MKRHASEEAFYQRLKELAQTDKPIIKDNTRNLGTLIDYKRAADGIAYGIVKENHNYYIKKAGIKQDPNIADFAYIGGLSNIKEFQYSKLSEAEKQRNMIFGTINEGLQKVDKNGSKKKRLNEDKVGAELDNAESKMGDLEAATSAEAAPESPETAGAPLEPAPDAVSSEPAADTTEPAPDAEATDAIAGDETPAGEETPAEPAGEETPAPEGNATGEETPAPEGDATGEEQPAGDEEVEKLIGKLGEKVRKTDMEDNIVAGNLKSIIAAYKPKLKNMDIEDRKEIADGILKVVGDDEIEGLGDTVAQDEPKAEPEAGIEEEQCAECGGFGKYAESRGYSSPEAFMECGGEEQANVVNGYVGANEEGMNDGDEKTISLIIKLAPEVLDKLKSDYGRDDYAEKMQPQVDSMNESSEEDIMTQLKEGWGAGLAGLGKAALGAAGKGIANVAKGAYNAVADPLKGAYQTGKEVVGQAKQAYQAGSQAGDVRSGIKKKNAALGKLEALAADLGKQIAAANAGAVKAGQEPINVNSIIQTLSNQLRGSNGAANLSKYKSEGTMPVDQVQVQPNMLKEEEEEVEEPEKETPEVDIQTPETDVEVGEETPETGEETPEVDADDVAPESEEKPEFSFAPDAQTLGGGVVKPEGAGIEIKVEPDKTITLNMNEAKKQLIKTIAEGVNAYLKEGDDKWIQKAVNPEHKGDCTPMTKDTCTPHKKALAKRFKKGIEDESVQMTESEQKLRKYIRARLEEHAGIRKPSLNESKKSPTLVKLDAVIDNQFKLFEAVALKKKDKINEVLGLDKLGINITPEERVASAFKTLDPNNQQEIERLWELAFKNILINPHMGAIGVAAKSATPQEKYNILAQYVKGGGGTLRTAGGKVVYAPKEFQDKGTISKTVGGGTRGQNPTFGE